MVRSPARVPSPSRLRRRWSPRPARGPACRPRAAECSPCCRPSPGARRAARGRFLAAYPRPPVRRRRSLRPQSRCLAPRPARRPGLRWNRAWRPPSGSVTQSSCARHRIPAIVNTLSGFAASRGTRAYVRAETQESLGHSALLYGRARHRAAREIHRASDRGHRYSDLRLPGAVQAPYGPLLPGFQRAFGIGAGTVGLLFSAHGLGALLGILLPSFVRVPRRSRSRLASAFTWCASTACSSRASERAA
jgi:hypothetical protein